jgi:Fe-S cluster biogenesis protein NfuA/nitrite reductase/ring-hydroxylating ferredoxin subunit
MEDRELIERVEGHLEELESLADERVRDVALDTVQAVLDLYGAGLQRILGRVDSSLVEAMVEDELVEHLLLLHGLHPVSVEERVRTALDGVRPYLGSHGGDVELIGVTDGAALVRMRGSCEGCPASAMTLKLAIEDAVLKGVPDVERVEAAEDADRARPVPSPLLSIEVRPAASSGVWAAAGALPQLAGGALLVEEVAGEPILFLRIADGTPYAYRPECPVCQESLATGALESSGLVGAEITCPGCQHRFDVVRAGRCLDAPGMALEPVPLLVDDGGSVRVAVGAGVG